jgi:HSP20 family protein
LLTIRVEKRIEREQKDDKKKEDKQRDEKENVQLAERSYGVFYRVLQLPPGVDPSSTATMANGVLKVLIPKPVKPQAKKIEVKEAETAKAA